LAQVAFIYDAYGDDAAVRKRLFAAIYPNTSHSDDGCYWIEECAVILVEANRRGKDRIFDQHANLTFECADKGIVGTVFFCQGLVKGLTQTSPRLSRT
jgi:hypothetical protein